MVCGLQLLADLVGEDTDSGAFVYGVFGFKEKMMNGVIIMLLQVYNDDSSKFIKIANLIPGIACVLGLIGVLLFINVEALQESVTVSLKRKKTQREKLKRAIIITSDDSSNPKYQYYDSQSGSVSSPPSSYADPLSPSSVTEPHNPYDITPYSIQ